MLETSVIVGMSGAAKAKLFAERATALVETRYEATLALASLEATLGFLELGYGSVRSSRRRRPGSIRTTCRRCCGSAGPC